MQDATAKVLAATKAAGKYAGHFALNADIGEHVPVEVVLCFDLRSRDDIVGL